MVIVAASGTNESLDSAAVACRASFLFHFSLVVGSKSW